MSSWSPKLAAFQPPRTPVPRTSGENMVAAMDVFGKTGRVNDMGWLWRGMEYLYYPCQYSNRDGWVARYPVAFHGHVTRSPAYNCSPRSRWKLESPAVREVHARFRATDGRFVPWGRGEAGPGAAAPEAKQAF